MVTMLRLLSQIRDGQIGDNAKVAVRSETVRLVTVLMLLIQIRDGQIGDNAKVADSDQRRSDW